MKYDDTNVALSKASSNKIWKVLYVRSLVQNVKLIHIASKLGKQMRITVFQN